jgi:hypothetical protein
MCVCVYVRVFEKKMHLREEKAETPHSSFEMLQIPRSYMTTLFFTRKKKLKSQRPSIFDVYSHYLEDFSKLVPMCSTLPDTVCVCVCA